MLRIADVSFQYAKAPAPALDALTLDIPEGGVYGLLGPNGAGKTTLISLLAGLSTPNQGNIAFDGLTLSQLRVAHPRAIALVPQDYAFYPMLTVAENLAFFAGVVGLGNAEQPRQTEAAIAFARLEQVTTKRAEQLSGGLRRRLNLAIGLLGQPRLLLLDEPTVGVDPQSRSFLLESIAGLPAAGTTVLYTSHYMEEVEAICQRVAILDQGRLLAEGTLDALLATPDCGAEIELDRPMPAALIERHGAIDRGHHQFGLFFRSTADAAQLLEELSQAGCAIRQFRFGRHNLEDLFMRLTRRSLRD